MFSLFLLGIASKVSMLYSVSHFNVLMLQVDREERPDVDKVYNVLTVYLIYIFGGMSAESTYEDMIPKLFYFKEQKMVFINYPKFLWNLND